MIIDSISAWTIEAGDFVVIEDDHLEVKSMTDKDDSVEVEGFSYDTGDTVTYDIPCYTMVDVWVGLD